MESLRSINRLLGEERLVVNDEAGTTRDAIDTPMTYHGREIIFVDTAGLRRQSKIDDGIEFYSSLRTRRAIERADICILVLDAVEGLHNQDLKIAALAWESGRGLIVVVNKWDLEGEGEQHRAKFQKEAQEKAPFLKFVPFIFTSALTGQRVTKILGLLLEVDAERNKRITTSQVNTTLEEIVGRRQPPQAAGREMKLNYATQVETAPPVIAVFGNNPDLVQEHYIRYLHNSFREAWGFRGSPLRIVMRRKSQVCVDVADRRRPHRISGRLDTVRVSRRQGCAASTFASMDREISERPMPSACWAAKIGAAVFIVDLLKGLLPVYFLPRYAETLRPELWAMVFGVAAILGHVKPIFLLWKGGGKGVATAGGVFLGARIRADADRRGRMDRRRSTSPGT